MNRYLKLSLVVLCGFASIQASQLKSSQASQLRLQTSRYQFPGIGFKIPHSNNRATLVLQGLSVGVAAYVGGSLIKQWKISNKHNEARSNLDNESQRLQAERLKLDQENQRLLKEQNDKLNGYTEQNVTIAKSNNTVEKVNTGVKAGGAIGAGGALAWTGAGVLAKTMAATAVVGGGGAGAGAAGAAAAGIGAAVGTVVGGAALLSGGALVVGGIYVVYKLIK